MLYNTSDKWNKIWVRSCPTGMWEEILEWGRMQAQELTFSKFTWRFSNCGIGMTPLFASNMRAGNSTSFLSCVVLQELCVIFLRFCLPCVIIHVIWLFFCGLWAYSKPELEGLWHYGHTQSASHTHITKDAGSDWASMPVLSYFLSPHFPQSPQQRI